MARATPDPAQASPDEIVDEIEQIRDRLSDTIDELVDRVKPANLAKRQVERVKEYFVDDETGPRFEHIVPVVTGTIATFAALVVLRRLLK